MEKQHYVQVVLTISDTLTQMSGCLLLLSHGYHPIRFSQLIWWSQVVKWLQDFQVLYLFWTICINHVIVGL